MRVSLVSLIRFYWLTDLHDNTTRISLSLCGDDDISVSSAERSGKISCQQDAKPGHVRIKRCSYSPSVGVTSGRVHDGQGG